MQPTTYGTKNRCRHIHGHTHNTCRLKYIYTHSQTVFSSSCYGCRLEMLQNLSSLFLKEPVVLAEMTDSGKLFVYRRNANFTRK